MRIWLDQVRDEPFRWDETVSIAPETLDRPELLHLGPVHWRGQVTFADPGYFLQGTASYEQTLGCIRCLKPISEASSPEVELLVLNRRPPQGAGEHALNEEELGVQYVEGEHLDLDPILYEQLQLNVPMKPLCRPDCRGICPVCGKDRNLEDCSCETAEIDPRWAALASFKGGGGETNH